MKKLRLSLILLGALTILSGCIFSGEPQEIQVEDELFEEQKEQEIQQENNQTSVIDPDSDEYLQELLSNETLKQYLAEQEKERKLLEDELNYYKNYVKDLIVIFTPEKIEQLIEKEWNYNILVNNIKFPNNGVLEISDKNFLLVFSEERVPFSVLPEEESLKGKINNRLQNSVTLRSETTDIPSPVIKNEKHSTFIEYQFQNVPSRTEIKIKLTDELREKIGYSSNELTIIVNHEN